jgi:hypothetical protein
MKQQVALLQNRPPRRAAAGVARALVAFATRHPTPATLHTLYLFLVAKSACEGTGESPEMLRLTAQRWRCMVVLQKWNWWCRDGTSIVEWMSLDYGARKDCDKDHGR